MTTVFAGAVIHASENNNLETRVAALEALGYVTSAVDTTSNISTTTTEAVSSSVQFTATAGIRYVVMYMGVAESTVAGDIITVQLRWKNSSTADTTGTMFSTENKTAIANSKGDGFVLLGDFNGQSSGTVTVVATVVRNSGTGSVKQNLASSGQRGYFLVTAVRN